ncbi:hypothetical protein DM791_20365 [Paenarthrobacter nitroguajacolicus]|nr:hypothetical protein [Paenarthrobacter nitroguajacolicus]NWL35227.1 hypothetical protein [Paenarthrobacter nitroguajacolicus]
MGVSIAGASATTPEGFAWTSSLLGSGSVASVELSTPVVAKAPASAVAGTFETPLPGAFGIPATGEVPGSTTGGAVTGGTTKGGTVTGGTVTGGTMASTGARTVSTTPTIGSTIGFTASVTGSKRAGSRT